MISKEMRGILWSIGATPIMILGTIIILSIFMPQPTWYQQALLYSIPIFVYNKLAVLNSFKQSIIISIFLLVIYNISRYWIYGAIVIIIGFIIYRLIRDLRKDKKGGSLYMTGLRDIEKRLFGKSLDKKNWKQEEEK